MPTGASAWSDRCECGAHTSRNRWSASLGQLADHFAFKRHQNLVTSDREIWPLSSGDLLGMVDANELDEPSLTLVPQSVTAAAKSDDVTVVQQPVEDDRSKVATFPLGSRAPVVATLGGR